MDHCSECGFTYESLTREQIPKHLLESANEFRVRLIATDEGWDDRLRRHRAQGVWSALEYSCHVRDVLVVQHVRLNLALATPQSSEPFVPMNRDERAVDDRYNEQSPSLVAAELVEAAEELAGAFADLSAEQWEVEATYSDWRRIDLLWLGRHTYHELHHHLMDVDRQLA